MAIAPIAPYDIPSSAHWPACRAPWPFDPARAALLVHDMQQYFVRAFDPRTSPLRDLQHHIPALRAACAEAGMPVFFSAQPAEQSREERGLLWDVWGPGIVAQPEQEELVPGLRGPRDVLLPKRRYSAFHGTNLAEQLHTQGRDQLLICGVYAHIGCLTTALDGFMRGVQPFLIADAVADFSREDHIVALRQVARTCGVVLSSQQVLMELAARSVRSVLTELLEGETAAQLGLDDDLFDHGLDSIRAIALAERILPPTQGRDFSELVEARTLRAFAELIVPAPLAQRLPETSHVHG